MKLKQLNEYTRPLTRQQDDYFYDGNKYYSDDVIEVYYDLFEHLFYAESQYERRNKKINK